jgi:hypothetical protein
VSLVTARAISHSAVGETASLRRLPNLPDRVLYDLGDFLDDYAVNRKVRNDLGLLVLVELDGNELEAIPLKLESRHTRDGKRECK